MRERKFYDGVIDITHPDNKNKVIELVKRVVCKFYNQDVSVINSKRRDLYIIKCKYTFIYLIIKNFTISKVEIGRMLGYNHATVIHAWKKINDLLEVDKQIRAEMKLIENILLEQSEILSDDGNVNNDFYYINMNEMLSVKTNGGKAILFVGYEREEVEMLKKQGIVPDVPVHRHNNTKMFILQNKAKHENNKDTV